MREVFWVMLSLSLSGAGLAAVVALLQRLLAKRLPAVGGGAAAHDCACRAPARRQPRGCGAA